MAEFKTVSLADQVFGGIVSGKAFDPLTDVHNIHQTFQGHTQDHRTLTGILDQTLLL